MARLLLLGPVDLRHDDGSELHRLLRQPKRFALLAYLAGGAPQVFHRRDRILALFWSESTTEQARHGLRQVLYELRNHLGEDVIVARGVDEIAVNQAMVACDVADLHAALQDGDLDRAMELYRGPFLDAFFVSGAPELMDWIDRRRAELLRLVLDGAWRLVEQRVSAEDLAGAVAVARKGVEWSPTDEVGVRRLIELLHAQGNVGEAIRVYDRLAHRLSEEFEVKPAAETVTLVETIRTAGGANDLAQPDTLEQIDPPVRGTPTMGSTDPGGRPLMMALLFGAASMVTLAAANGLVLALGLPEWVFWAAVTLVSAGFPVILATALSERGRIRGSEARALWLTWRRAGKFGVLAFAGLGVLTTGFMGLRALGVEPAATLITKGLFEPRDRLLVADVTNRTSDPTLGATLTELLLVDLSQSRVIRVVEPATIGETLERMRVGQDEAVTERVAREVAERDGATAVLVGEVSQVGPGYVLSAKLISAADGALLGAERVTARDDTELIGAIDRLSYRVRERIGESLRDIRATPPLDRVTTASLPALRKYTAAMGPEGLQGGSTAGVRLLQEAIELDPSFAMAYRGLGVRLIRTGRPTEGRAALARAFELRERLPEVERHIVAGMYYTHVAFDASAVDREYRAALALDPDNYLALINLGARQSWSRQWAVREELALRSLGVRRTLVGVLNAFDAQLLQGKLEQAEATVRSVGGSGELRGARKFELEVARGEYDLAENTLRTEDGTPEQLGDLMLLRGRLAEAERWYRQWLDDTDAASSQSFRALEHLAHVQILRGSSDEAIGMLEHQEWAGLAPLERRYLERAELYATVGRVEEARTLVGEFEQEVDPAVLRRPWVRASLAGASGEIAVAEGRFAEAAAHFEEVYELSGQCETCGLARLGYTWLQSGRPDSARSTFERMLSIPTGRGIDDDFARGLPEVHLRLAELYEERHDTVNAVARYSSFIELWRNADPELQPQVAAARSRLEALRRGRERPLK